MILQAIMRRVMGLWTCEQLRRAKAAHAEVLCRLHRALDGRECLAPARSTSVQGQHYGRRKDDHKPA